MTPEELEYQQYLDFQDFQAYQASQQTPPPAETTAGRVFGGGFQNLLNAITLGFGDEAVAGVSALSEQLPSFLGGTNRGISEAYDANLETARNIRNEFRQEAGGLQYVHDVGGGGLLPIGKGLSAAKTYGSKILEAAKLGGSVGGAQGFGESEGGFLNRLKGGAIGAGAGAALGALITTALKGASDLGGHFTSKGQERKAAEILREAAGDQGVKNIELNALTPDDAFGTKTFAEVAQTPGAANLEVALKKDLREGNPLMIQLADRQTARKGALASLTPDELGSVTPDLRGARIREKILPTQAKAEKLVEKSWAQVKEEGSTFDASSVVRRALKSAETLRTPLGYSKDAQKVLGALVSADDAGTMQFPRIMDVDEYQKIRSAAGEVFADAAAKGRNREAKLMATIREALDTSAERATKPGGTMSDQTLKSFQNAISTTRNYKQTYESGVPGQLVKKGDVGYSVAESQIPSRVLRSPEAAKQFVKAFGANKAAMMEVRGAALDEMTKKGPDTWPQYFEKNRAQLREIFGPDYIKVKKVIQDLTSEQSVGKLSQAATGRGSITPQGLSAAKFLESRLKSIADYGGPVIGGVLGTASGGPMAGAAGTLLGVTATKGLEKAALESQQKIKSIIVQALRDPKFAQEIMSKPSETAVAKLSDQLVRSLSPEVGIQSGKGDQRNKLKERSPIPTQSPSHGLVPNTTRKIDSPVSSPSFNNRPNPPTTQEKLMGPSIFEVPLQEALNVKVGESPIRNVKTLIERQPPLVQAIIKVESSRRPEAVSSKGARGLMQVMPANLTKLGLRGDDPAENIQAGSAILSEEMERYGDIRLALAAYNAGSPKVNAAIKRARSRRWQDIYAYLPKETRAYPGKVLSELNKISKV